MKRSRAFDEQEILEFARSYLSEAFPNPERSGCPHDEALRVLAEHPMDSHKSVSGHLTLCSPCFNAYVLHLSRVRAEAIQSHRTHRIIWIRRSILALGATAVLAIATSIFLARRHQTIVQRVTPTERTTPDRVSTAAYVPVLIDLSHAIPTRGSQPHNAGPPLQIMLSGPDIELVLQLPLGSEDRVYSVKLVSNGRAVWSDSTEAHLENGRVMLRMHAQFGSVRPGNYLLVADTTGIRFTKSVLVKVPVEENTPVRR